MTWFENLTEIVEHDTEHVRLQLELEGEWLRSRANGQRWRFGGLQAPSLAELRQRASS